jgi:hypothetical protein
VAAIPPVTLPFSNHATGHSAQQLQSYHHAVGRRGDKILQVIRQKMVSEKTCRVSERHGMICQWVQGKMNCLQLNKQTDRAKLTVTTEQATIYDAHRHVLPNQVNSGLCMDSLQCSRSSFLEKYEDSRRSSQNEDRAGASPLLDG